MVHVTRLAHVGLQARSLSTQAEFYNDRWGLERVDEFGREMFFRADGPDHHVLTLNEGDTSGLHHVALQVPRVDDIDRAYEDLLARGIEIVTPPTADLEPGVKRALRLRDPDGFVIELVAGVESVNDPFKHADVKPTALNHVVLNVRDQSASEAFYGEALGFKLTDRFVGGLSFWACNANHHSLAFGQARDGNSAFHHAAFEMRDWQEWINAVFYAGERGIPRAWGPGRHLFGNNLFSYYKDPEGNTVEYTAEVEQITDPDRQPRVMEPYPDQWRSASSH
ncbi:MAG TPA: VOC family protein [Ktedonobacterales bacterium]|nr:VOC family protein [Ktedonobacterales bacterium]